MQESPGSNSTLAKIPIGVPSLDSRLRGGVRPGTTLLLIGPFGAGAREFLGTAALMHGNWQAETELFELEYGAVEDSVRRPSQVRFISLNDTEKTFRRHLHDLADDDVAYPALEHLDLQSLATEIADLGPVKPSRGRGFEYKFDDEQSGDEYESVFQKFDDLIEATPGEIVFVDAISDFIPITRKFLDPEDLYFISQTLCHVASESNSILIAAADSGLLTPTQEAMLRRTFEAVLDFGWFGQGMQQRRTLTVTKFPEFWRESDSNGRISYDLQTDRGNFGISQIEKIPPGRYR